MNNFKAKWKKTHDSRTSIKWKNYEDMRISIEAFDLEEQSREPENEGMWYVFGAVNGKGVPTSPEIVNGKGEAIRVIAKLKKEYEKFGVDGFR